MVPFISLLLLLRWLLYGSLTILDYLDDPLCAVKTVHEHPECLVDVRLLLPFSTFLQVLVVDLKQIVGLLHVGELSLNLIESLFRLNTCYLLASNLQFFFVLRLQSTDLLVLLRLH